MHFARVLRAALPLLSFVATGALAGQEGEGPIINIVDFGKLGWHRQRWPEINAYAVMTDFVLEGGKQEFSLLVVPSPNVGKVTITFPATKNSVSLDKWLDDDHMFAVTTGATKMDAADEQALRPCLESVMRKSSKIVGSPFQDIDHCLKKFNFKLGGDPKEYYLDDVRRYK